MRVGFVLQDPARRPTGLDVYTQNLWDALNALRCDYDLVPVTLPARWAASAYLRVIWEQTYLPMWALRQRIDLLHVPAGSTPILRRGPCVMTLHDLGDPQTRRYQNSFGPRLYFGHVVPASVRFANAIMADSAATKHDAVTRLGIPEERITVVALAASPEFRRLPETSVTQVRDRYDLGNPYFFQVGAPVPRKNLSGSLKGFARFVADNPNAQADFVAGGGDGRSQPSVPAEARQLLEAGRVRFLGHLPQDDLVALYNGALAVVMPSFYEGFGLPLVEAFACGTPAIASRASSLPEVGGDAALYVDPRDPSTIAEAMTRYVTSSALRSKMRQRALQQSRRFSWRTTAQQTHEVYRRALRGRNAASSSSSGKADPKVLFVRLDSLGDVVLTTPCFEAIKRRHPSAQVDVVVQPDTAPVLESSKHVNRVFTLAAPWHGAWRLGSLADTARMVHRLRRERYDYVITLRRDLDDALFARLCGGRETLGFYAHRTRPLLSRWVNFQPGKHTVDNHLQLMSLLGCEADDISPTLTCTAEGSEQENSLVAEADEERPLIGLAPFASSEAKTLDPTQTAALIDEMSETLQTQVVLLGGRADRASAADILSRAAAPAINLAGQTSIPALCDVLRRCSLLVCVDSGPMHLAAALGTSTVAMFGEEDPALWGPYGGAPHRVLQAPAGNGQVSSLAIPNDMVLAAARQLLNAAVGKAKEQHDHVEIPS